MSWKTTKEVEKNIKSGIMCLPERWHSKVFILTIVSVPYRKSLNSTPNPFINYEYTNARITPPSFFLLLSCDITPWYDFPYEKQ